MPYKFKIWEEGHEPFFTCTLNSERCTANGANGQRCKKRSIIGIPLCWIHLETQSHLKIKESLIPDIGKGLFALNKRLGNNAVVFPRGAIIVEYIGQIINEDILDERYANHTAVYAMNLPNGDISDSACRRGVSSLINHKAGRESNCRFDEDPNDDTKVVVRATKNIRNNEELYVNYGRGYVFEPNIKHITK
jgi:hypothetical protein